AFRAVRWTTGAVFREGRLMPIEQYAGDDEHRRHRQHMCKGFRGRPLGGFLHAGFSLTWARRIVARRRARPSEFFTRNTPRRVSAPIFDPHEADIDCASVEQY